MMKLYETNVCCERFQPFTISDLSGILKMSAELARIRICGNQQWRHLITSASEPVTFAILKVPPIAKWVDKRHPDWCHHDV